MLPVHNLNKLSPLNLDKSLETTSTKFLASFRFFRLTWCS